MKILVSDLDGTLIHENQYIESSLLQRLKKFKATGNKIIIATGRSLYSAKKIIDSHFPVDYMITASGAGIYSWNPFRLLKKYSLSEGQIKKAVNVLKQLGLDFTIQRAVPENHRYFYHAQRNLNDFVRRNELYNGYASPLTSAMEDIKEACQLIAFAEEKDGEQLYHWIKNQLPALKIIRSTSPLDHKTVWIEIYPPEVSKKAGIEFILKKENLSREHIFVIGNDYNDEEMLSAFPQAWVVANAPDSLQSRYQVLKNKAGKGVEELLEMLMN